MDQDNQDHYKQIERDLINEALDSVFDEYKGTRINRPALMHMVLQKLHIIPQNWRMVEERVLDVLKERSVSGDFTVIRGAFGGLLRTKDASQEWVSYAALVEARRIEILELENRIDFLRSTPVPRPDSKPVESALQNASASPVNNHTCGCGNTACNKAEKSCWKCGAPIS